MELVGQDLTNLPLGLSLPRAKLPIFTYQQEQPPSQQQLNQPSISLQQNTTATSTTQCLQYLPSTQQPFSTLVMSGNQYVQSQHQCYQQQGGGGGLSDDDSGYDLMDDSLTDMQWLQRMDAGMWWFISLTLSCSCVKYPKIMALS